MREGGAIAGEGAGILRMKLMPASDRDAERGNGGDENQGAAFTWSGHARKMCMLGAPSVTNFAHGESNARRRPTGQRGDSVAHSTLLQPPRYPMKTIIRAAFFVAAICPAIASAQANPLATAFRGNAAMMGKNLVAAAEVMPADKYSFKPTPAQMSYADIVMHLAGGNDALCGLIGGATAPTRTKIAASAGKDALVARLKETFAFCDKALANLDDSKLSEQLTLWGDKTSRAQAELETTGDWADHYSQMAIYLRLNGQLPPTAKK